LQREASLLRSAHPLSAYTGRGDGQTHWEGGRRER